MEFSLLLILLPAIIAFAMISRQSARIGRLEEEVRALKEVRLAPPPPEEQTVTERVSEALAGARAEEIAEALAPERPPEPEGLAVPPVPPVTNSPARPALSLETRFGARWPVYVGGLAMALGGLFLVRYSIEAGLVSPAVRLTMAAILGLLLVAGGELIRRRALPALNPLVDRKSPIPGIPGIPGVLTAAGSVILFGAIFAAQAVYGYVGPLTAVVLLAMVALSTIGLSLLHGQALAGLGLVGSLATPLLVPGSPPNLLFLFGYLTLCHMATLAVCRLRDWRIVPVLSLLGYGGWMAAMTLIDEASILPALGTAVLLASAVMLRTADEADAETVGDGLWSAVIDHLVRRSSAVLWVATLMALLTGFLSAAATYGDGGFHMVLVVASLALAALFARGGGMALAAALLAGLGFPLQTAVMPEAQLAGATLADLTLLLTLVGIFLVFGAASYLRPRDRHPGRLLIAALVTAAPPLFLLVFGNYDPDWHMIGADDPILSAGTAGVLALLLALLLTGLAEVASRLRPTTERFGAAVNLALIGFAVLAIAFALDRLLPAAAFLPVLALVTLVLVLALRLRDWPGLAYAPGIAFALSLITIFADATLVGPMALGRTPVFNALLPGYGIPALAFIAAAILLSRRADPRPTLLMQAAGSIMSLLAVAVLVRHAMNGGALYGAGLDLGEQSIYALVLIGASAIFMIFETKSGSPVFRWLGLIAGGIGMLTVLSLHGVVLNPAMTGEAVGRFPIANLLLVAYLMPALGYGLLLRLSAGRRPPVYRAALAISGLLMLLGWITLSVRQLYQGTHLALWQGMSQAENYSYSVAWLLFGIGLLTLGLLRQSRPLRLASAGFVLLAVLKAFLYDMSTLEGIFRAASFMGLGAVLIGIGILYQRLILRIEPTSETDPS